MKYDAAFFEMIKLRGEELYPLSLPYAWHSVRTAAGIVLMDKENKYQLMHGWLSWVRTDAPDLVGLEARTQVYHPRKHHAAINTATNKQLEKMSGDDIVHLLATHFLFMDLQHDAGTVETNTED